MIQKAKTQCTTRCDGTRWQHAGIGARSINYVVFYIRSRVFVLCKFRNYELRDYIWCLTPYLVSVILLPYRNKCICWYVVFTERRLWLSVIGIVIGSIVQTVAPIFFCMKILSEDPYLKFFISRVCSKHRECFCSYQASVIRLPVATYFLSSLPCDDRTKAVKAKFDEYYHFFIIVDCGTWK